MLAPVLDLDRRCGLGAERDVVRADLDRRDDGLDDGGRGRRKSAQRIASARLRAADCDDGDEPRNDGGPDGKTRPPEAEQHPAHLRRLADLSQDAVEPEAAPCGGQGDGEELGGGVVHGRLFQVFRGSVRDR